MREWLKREWFKVGWLVIGTAFVLVYFVVSHNGRYQYHKDTLSTYVFDSKEGVVYHFDYQDNKQKFIKWDYPSAEITVSEFKTR